MIKKETTKDPKGSCILYKMYIVVSHTTKELSMTIA